MVKFRTVTPSILIQDKVCVRTLLASMHMVNAQNMIDEHFAKGGVFEVWKR